jgi:hypothetical protein
LLGSPKPVYSVVLFSNVTDRISTNRPFERPVSTKRAPPFPVSFLSPVSMALFPEKVTSVSVIDVPETCTAPPSFPTLSRALTFVITSSDVAWIAPPLAPAFARSVLASMVTVPDDWLRMPPPDVTA